MDDSAVVGHVHATVHELVIAHVQQARAHLPTHLVTDTPAGFQLEALGRGLTGVTHHRSGSALRREDGQLQVLRLVLERRGIHRQRAIQESPLQAHFNRLHLFRLERRLRFRDVARHHIGREAHNTIFAVKATRLEAFRVLHVAVQVVAELVGHAQQRRGRAEGVFGLRATHREQRNERRANRKVHAEVAVDALALVGVAQASGHGQLLAGLEVHLAISRIGARAETVVAVEIERTEEEVLRVARVAVVFEPVKAGHVVDSATAAHQLQFFRLRLVGRQARRLGNQER